MDERDGERVRSAGVCLNATCAHAACACMYGASLFARAKRSTARGVYYDLSYVTSIGVYCERQGGVHSVHNTALYSNE